MQELRWLVLPTTLLILTLGGCPTGDPADDDTGDDDATADDDTGDDDDTADDDTGDDDTGDDDTGDDDTGDDDSTGDDDTTSGAELAESDDPLVAITAPTGASTWRRPRPRRPWEDRPATTSRP